MNFHSEPKASALKTNHKVNDAQCLGCVREALLRRLACSRSRPAAPGRQSAALVLVQAESRKHEGQARCISRRSACAHRSEGPRLPSARTPAPPRPPAQANNLGSSRDVPAHRLQRPRQARLPNTPQFRGSETASPVSSGLWIRVEARVAGLGGSCWRMTDGATRPCPGQARHLGPLLHTCR